MRRNVGTILFTAVLGVVLMLASASEAGTIRLQRVDPRRAQSERVVRKPGKTVERAQTVRMQGILKYDRQRGLSLDGIPVLIDRRTAVSSERLDGTPSARDLGGAAVMLYGVRTSRGVRATIILDRREASLGARTRDMIAPDRAIIRPGNGDARTGVYLENSPS